ncbi:MAG TPA: Ig-like domain-containing protein [Phycisphaerales bacterium]|nr:Ig-like domain-containing protein [Phycisphaerales bacterium]
MPLIHRRAMRTFPCAALVCLAATTSAQDFAEGNAASWGTFAADNAARSVANDAQYVKAGSSSILFTTQSGFDTGVRYPATPTWNYNASAFNTLVFWENARNTTPIGWQGNQPIVVVRTGTGTIALTPTTQQTPNFAWKLFKVPLAGGHGWTRTQTGAPNLADVDQIEIHHDTWDAGFQINFDGVRFMHLDPNGLPPAGPPPPAGVDPDKVEPRVLLFIFDPVMENFGGQRLHAVYGWDDPVALANQVRLDFLTSSHGKVDFQIVETVIADEHPRFQDGFRHTDESFAAAWAVRDFHNSTFDYVHFGQTHNLGARVDAGEIDEVWVYAPPIAGMWEAAMAGQGAYWVNGVPYPAAGGQRAFVIMGWNYERGVGEAIHSWGHRAESTMADKVYGQWCQSRCNTWSRFALLDQHAPGLGGVGNVHFPVNATSDYDYANPRFVASNADAWLSYPNLNDATRVFNYTEWSPPGGDHQRNYLNWWYAHMPHAPGRAPDGYLANWWRYLCDVDQFKAGNANLVLTIGIPSVAITQPQHNASVSGVVVVRAAAEVDGAMGRADLYIDGQYAASDTLMPFRFELDTALLSPGPHELVIKAHELQNGTQTASAPVTIVVTPMCDAIDFNGDGLFPDNQDLLDFFAVFGGGDCPTGTCGDLDFNNDGLFPDNEDILALFRVFGGGAC